MLGGGVLVTANVFASATEGETARTASVGQAYTVDCPDVGTALTSVPEQAKEDVDKELALLDQQIAEAYQRLKETSAAQQQDPGFVDNAILGPLKDKRAATIARILQAIDRVGDPPQGLEGLAGCTAVRSTGAEEGQEDQQGQAGEEDQEGSPQPSTGDGGQGGQGAGQAGAGQGGNGPVVGDFADIMSVNPNAPRGPQPSDASPGTFASDCGVNAGGLFNSDNIIAAPGVTNGAHHFHDYIGNQSNNGLATIDDLAKAETSCKDQGDKSSYYWPVVRVQDGTVERDAQAPGGGTEGNAGRIVTPKQVTLTFVGNPVSKVTPMPRLLRIITGDAKAFVNGPANANASWSCTGLEDRQLKDRYPLCPDGSDVVRTFRFQSCWDGQNVDSANHRTHVAFADAGGNCPQGFKAIPQLVQRIVYDVKAPSVQDGGKTVPLFAVDSFPENLHKPVTDHGDFINIFDEGLMREVADCINEGRTCGPGDDGAEEPGDGGNDNPGGEEPGDGGNDNPGGEEPGNGGNDNPGNGGNDNPGEEEPGNGGNDNPGNGGNDNPGEEEPGNGGNDNPGDEQPPADTPDDDQNGGGDTPDAPVTVTPKADSTPPAGQDDTATPPAGGHEHHGEQSEQQSAAPVQQTPAPGAFAPSPAGQANQQAINGGLADTGTNLWPAGLGAVLAIAGFLLLRQVKRGSN
ncbi:DUF1996 domain-containing protein [Actinacidiphila glaucinigra]|uniref:DUF1996 domain-containing protein n=1 Tax=Actinacidiphila glaucinigra TaxID=235986 RepID=UPI00324F6787